MRYLILGSSAAGINAAKTIRELDKSSEIAIISEDTKVYSRCMLHHVISGSRTVDRISFIEKDFFPKYKISWIKGKKVVELIIDKNEVRLNDGSVEQYDKLLIATGSSAVIPPIKNLREAKGVYTLRNISDVFHIQNSLKKCKNVVIIGAGLVGIDALIGIMSNNLKISVVEMGDRILPLQLDKKAAAKYEKLLSENGIDIYTSVKVEEVTLNKAGFVKEVILSNGTALNCDMVIVAAGVKANIDFVKDSKIKIDKGIVVDSTCKTTVENIYAAGDVCATAPIWPIAVKEAITAAYNMTGNYRVLDDNFGLRNSMNFLGLETVSLGIIDPPDSSYNVDILENKDIYKKIIHKDGIIYGALLVGDISYCGVLNYLIRNKLNISKIDKNIFQIDYSDFYNIKPDGQYAYEEVASDKVITAPSEVIASLKPKSLIDKIRSLISKF